MRTMERFLSGGIRNRAFDLKRLFDVSPDMFVIRDGRGDWLFANRTAQILYGIDEAQYAGTGFPKLADLCPLYRDLFLRAQEADEEAWRKRESTRTTVPITDRTGPEPSDPSTSSGSPFSGRRGIANCWSLWGAT